jgi:hypothetical protein
VHLTKILAKKTRSFSDVGLMSGLPESGRRKDIGRRLKRARTGRGEWRCDRDIQTRPSSFMARSECKLVLVDRDQLAIEHLTGHS